MVLKKTDKTIGVKLVSQTISKRSYFKNICDVFSPFFYQSNVLREHFKHTIYQTYSFNVLNVLNVQTNSNSDIYLEIKNKNLICTAF